MPRAAMVSSWAAKLDGLQSHLCEEAAQLLESDAARLDVDIDLLAQGFDSARLIGLCSRLNEVYGLELSPAIFFEHSSIQELSRYLLDEHAAAFASCFTVPAHPSTAITSTRSGLSGVPSDRDPIAIIGVSCCFPLAAGVQEFWHNLQAEIDCITEVPPDRWDWRAPGGEPSPPPARNDLRWGGFVAAMAEFDPLFFAISPREALLMDPQQRLLMTHVWNAIEDAGYGAESLSGTQTGIFVGTANSVYHEVLRRAGLPIDANQVLGMMPSLGPNRISFFLNLHGPSEPVDTSCSSSLVAIHRGVEAIRSGRCDMAIVGGVNALTSPDGHLGFSNAGMLSEDGRCKTFSSLANGYVRGEGVGMLVLKRLSAAERDRDNIYASIRGSAVNHGGRASSLTAPNPKAQAEVIKGAYLHAGVDPATVGYIEAHGTGTALGDPVEVNALKSAFRDLQALSGTRTAAHAYCGLGSVKTNIGHLELAAGVAGVIKVLLQMKHRSLVKSLHSEQLSPYLELDGSPFYVVRETQPWVPIKDAQGSELPLRAGISSFGIGGTNAHVVIEEYVARDMQPAVAIQLPAVIVLSAKSEQHLRQMVGSLLRAIETRGLGDPELPRIAYTLQVGRDAFEQRLAVSVNSVRALVQKLRLWLGGEAHIEDLHRGEAKRNADAFTFSSASAELHEMRRGNYSKLLSLWVQGLRVDWELLYPQGVPGRISLPTYPFSKERYWPVPESRSATSTRDAQGWQPTTSTWPVGSVVLTPVWDVRSPSAEGLSRELVDGLLIAGGDDDCRLALQAACPRARVLQIDDQPSVELLLSRIGELGTIPRLIWIAPAENSTDTNPERLIAGQERGVVQVFRLSRALLDLGYARQQLEWTVVTFQAQPIGAYDPVNATHAAVHGFMGALAKEMPKWRIRLVDLQQPGDFPVADILALPTDHRAHPWVRRGSEWYQYKLIPFEQQPQKSPYRQGGVYVVIGGAGTVGEAWSEHVIRNHAARVIWIGRRPQDSRILAKLERLGTLGHRPCYIAADASDLVSMQKACQEIKRQYGEIHGIVNSATLFSIRDIAQLQESELQAALSATVAVSVRMNQVFGGERLDFVLFFSSLVSYIRNGEQSHYAAGCAFKDAYAHYLSKCCSCPVKIINWGYWSPETLSGDTAPLTDRFVRLSEVGVGLIDPSQAMTVLDAHLSGPVQQIGYLRTVRAVPLEGVDIAERLIEYPYGTESACEDLAAACDSASARGPERVEEFLADIAVILTRKRVVTDSSARLRLLEIGAETRGASALLLRALLAGGVRVERYQYVSSIDLLTSTQSRDLRQLFEPASHDLVVAFDAFRDVENIRETLRRIKFALRRNGSLFIMDGQAASAAQLRAEGFTLVRELFEDTRDQGRRILIAQSDGVIRDLRSHLARIDRPANRSRPTNGESMRPALLERLQYTLRGRVARLLSLDVGGVDPDMDLIELGFNSIMMIQLANLLEESCEMELAPTVFFEHRSVRSFSTYVMQQYGLRVAETLAARE